MFEIDIKNVGKIENAEIGISALTLFVGRNNTGKSYAAAMVWAAFKMYELFRSEVADTQRPKWLSKLLEEGQKEGLAQLDIGERHADQLIEYVNKLWRASGDEYIEKTFAFRVCQDSNIEFRRIGEFQPFNVVVSFNDVATVKRTRRFIFDVIIDRGTGSEYRFRRPFIADLLTPATRSHPISSFILNLVFRVLLGPTWQTYFPVLYIPAGRTGLMTGFKALQAYGLENDGDPSQSAIISAPVRDFLQDLTFLSGIEDDTDSSVANWMEREILHGALQMNDDDAASVTYRPENSDADIPLHAASSMITELAPFLISLKENSGTGLIIFEEPEAHLHLAAQRTMARGLARLVNSGKKLVVTTHSDTFVQQINNLMALHGHSKRSQLMSELGYEEEDLIDPKETAAFEFIAENGRSQVKRLNLTKEGFIVPSLNETLYALAKETVLLQEDSDD